SSPAPAGSRLVNLVGQARRVGRPQRNERLLGVDVRAVLGEDRENQLRRRVQPPTPDLRAIQLTERIERVLEQARSVASEPSRPCERGIGLGALFPLRLRGRASGRGLDRVRRLPRRGGRRIGRAHELDDGARPRPRSTSRAIRSPQRSSGSAPASIACATVSGRSTTGMTTAPSGRRASIPSGSTPPPTAMQATDASAARRATPRAVLPKAV